MTAETPNIATAPWELTGSGVIMPFWLSSEFKTEHCPDYLGKLGVVMWVNYETSPVGPYREWMFIAGKKHSVRGRCFSIDKIFVDSHDSVVSGRANWGIPKEYAEFQWQETGKDLAIDMQLAEATASVCGVVSGPTLPITSALLPFTLFQSDTQQDFWTKPKATGKGQWFRVKSHRVTGEGLPNLTNQRALGAFKISDFTMRFPEAIRLPASVC